MSTGIELMLSTVLCLGCETNLTAQLPPGLIILDSNGAGVIKTSDKVEPTVDPSLEDFEVGERVEAESQRLKQAHLQKLRNWLKGRHLRIATLEDYPLSYTRLENGKRLGRGVAFEIINFLQQKFAFSYEILVPEANIIGSTEDSHQSLIELLNTTNADIAAAFIPLLTDCRGFIAYSSTILDEGEWIMVMQRPLESATGSGLLAPFEFWVWILILVSLLAVGPIIYVLIILRNKLTGDKEQRPYGLSACAWFVYGALMKQGSILSPVADSTRLLFATWWIFITILTSFYTANLTAFLTLSKFKLPYNTVGDILSKNKHFVSLRGGGIEYSIRNTNESLSMLYKMIQNNRALFSEAVNDSYNLGNYVERYGYVFVRDRPAINHMLYNDYKYRKSISLSNEKIHCPFALAKEPFLKKKRSFAYPIGSNLSELFDPELLNLVESGIVKHLSAANLPNAEICPQDLGGTERQLRNSDLMMTYYIMFAGFATSVVVFTTEMIFRCVNGRHEASKWAQHGKGRTCRSPEGLTSHWPIHGFAMNNKSKLATHLNVTPPPPYQSIFGASRAKRSAAENNDYNDSVGFNKNYLHDKPEFGGVNRVINGRNYLVVRTTNGQKQLMPLRAPSATLFQYTYTE